MTLIDQIDADFAMTRFVLQDPDADVDAALNHLHERVLALLLVEVHQEPRAAENINENTDTRVVERTDSPLPVTTAGENEATPSTVSDTQVSAAPASIQQAAIDLYDDLFILRKLATTADDDDTYDAIMAFIELRMLQAFAHEGIDTQYGAPLATASENQTAPATDGLTFAALRDINKLRCETAFHSVEAWAPWEWSNAMAGECGEACNVTKKMNRIWPANQFKQSWNKPEDRRMADLETKLADEIADVVIYADLLATRIGRSLGDCVRHKFNEKSDEIGSPIKLLTLPEQRVIRHQDDEGKGNDDQARGRTGRHLDTTGSTAQKSDG